MERNDNDDDNVDGEVEENQKENFSTFAPQTENKINNVFTIALAFNNYTVTVSFFFSP